MSPGGQISRKQAVTVIVLFVAGLVAFSTAYIRSQIGTHPTRATRPGTTLSSPGGNSAHLPSPQRSSDDYQIIGKRNLFAAPKEPEASSQPVTTVSSVSPTVSGFSKAVLPPMPSPLMRARPFMSTRSRITGMTSSSHASNIAATGIVHLNKTPYVLLEQTERGESSLVRIGEQAFGYTVISAIGEQVTLQGPQGMLTLRLGDNKQEKVAGKQEGATPPAVSKPPEPPKPAEAPAKPPGLNDMLNTEAPVTSSVRHFRREETKQ